MKGLDCPYTRVLLVNVSLAGDSSGTGHTLRNLFGGLPQSSMMQLSLQLEPPEVRTTIDNTVFISERSIRVYLRLRRMIERVREGAGRSADDSGAPRSLNSVKQVSLAGRARSTLSGLLDMTPCVLTPELLSAVVEFDPTVIYTAGSSIRVHTVANRLARNLAIPIVLHLMDDWPETVYKSTSLLRVVRRRLLWELAQTNALSVSNFAISQPLCVKYSCRYGREYLPLMNPAVSIVDRVSPSAASITEFLYAGSVGLGREESLVEIAHAVSEANRDRQRAHLTLYLPESQHTPQLIGRFASLGADVQGYLPVAELQERYSDAAVLIHVESFVREYREFTKLSLSTKIPECMGAGKPILAYLPSDLYGSAYIRERQCGVVVNRSEELQAAVRTLIEEPELRQRLAECGLTAARREHSIEFTRARLCSTLDRATPSETRQC